jgi:TolB-like protein
LADVTPSIVPLGALTLDLWRGRLTGPDGDIPLRAKSFTLLTYLVQHQGRVLTKEELMAFVWPNVIVSDESLTQCVHDLRRALGENGSGLLRTIPRRGYMLDIKDNADALQAVPGSIAVLPFALEGPDTAADQVLFDGLTHDVIGRLARMRSFFVIGRGSCFALRHMADRPVELGQRLQVAYAVTGRVVRRGGRFRLYVDLLDCADGQLLWTETCDMATDQIMLAAETLPDQIAASIQREVTTSELQRAATTPENLQPNAWRLFHLGLHNLSYDGEDRLAAALALFQQATLLDPGFARAHAFQSFCHFNQVMFACSPGQSHAVDAANTTARAALQADPSSPVAHWAQGRALWLQKDRAAAIGHLRQALELCPSFPNAHYMIGFTEAHQGDAAQAIDDLTIAEALSPVDPTSASLQVAKATALARLGDTDAAIKLALRACRQHNGLDQLQGHAALLLAGLGAVDDARAILAKAPADQTDFRAATLFSTIYDMAADIKQVLHTGAATLNLPTG